MPSETVHDSRLHDFTSPEPLPRVENSRQRTNDADKVTQLLDINSARRKISRMKNMITIRKRLTEKNLTHFHIQPKISREICFQRKQKYALRERFGCQC